MAADNLIRFSISIPEELLRELDERVTSGGYPSRSEFIRDLIREQMVEDAWESGESEVVGVLTLIYDHHRHELTQKMIDIQHDHLIHVLCTTHVHIDHHNCLETIIIRGRSEEINRITTLIGGLKGVKFSSLTRTSPIH